MSIFNKLTEKLSEYIRIKGEKLKLDIITQVSKILAHFIVLTAILLILLFLFIFLSIALGAYLNAVMTSPHLGYLIVAGIYLLLLIGLLILLKTTHIQSWLEAVFVGLTDVTPEESEDE